MADKLLVKFWDVDSASVVKNGVESFQYGLLSEVHFIDEEPVAFFYCLQ
jgi:hypothetical protein